MFMETDRPPPSGPVAEGAYWWFMPLGVAFTTPGLIWLLALVFQQELTPPFAMVIDRYQALILMPFTALHDVASAVLPAEWRAVGEVWAHEITVFSFGGGAYVAAWYGAGLQRAFGWIVGFTLALALLLGLGLTLLGTAYLAITYMIVADGVMAIAFVRGDEDDVAIGVPLLVPVALAGTLLAANALV
jgi:hypothetical protein